MAWLITLSEHRLSATAASALSTTFYRGSSLSRLFGTLLVSPGVLVCDAGALARSLILSFSQLSLSVASRVLHVAVLLLLFSVCMA